MNDLSFAILVFNSVHDLVNGSHNTERPLPWTMKLP